MRASTILLEVLGGIILGCAMIYFHIGPGFPPKPPAYTPQYRDQLRVSYLNQISSGLQQYYHQYHNLPVSLSTTPEQICTSAGAGCVANHLADLSFLTTGGDFIIGIPHDPNGGHVQLGSGFYIQEASSNRLLLTAPEAEVHKPISATVNL